MHEALKRTIFIFIAACAAMSYCHAQPKALGTSYSISGISLTYEHYLNSECFLNTDLKAEMLTYFVNRNRTPGISASVSCNYIMKEWTSRNGNKILAIAGPGVVFGYSNDFRKDKGYFFGLKGRIGLECSFERNVSVSLTLNPILGSHMMLRDEYIEMRYYRNGIINTVLPEIGIKYTF